MNHSRHMTKLARIALLVTAGDLATKAAAKALLSTDAMWFSSWLHFAVVHNDQGAFGWSAGVYTWQLNLALTLAAIVFMIPVTRDLAKVDANAPRALGLIVGGALGNLASLITSPAGVVDFIQLDFAQVGLALNVADVAAYGGLAMIVRTGALVVAALRRESRLREPARTTAVRSVFAERAMIAGAMHGSRGEIAARSDREVVVSDWNQVARPISQVADGPSIIDADVVDIRHSSRMRGIVGDISPPRQRQLPRSPEGVELRLSITRSDTER